MREIDSRLRFLQKRTDALVGVARPPDEQDKVYFGAWVTLEDQEGEERTYRVVGPDEFDPDRGFISMDSPLGRAVLGRETGDEVTVRRPKGPATFTLLDVRYEPAG